MKNVLITGACINTGVAIVNKFLSEGWRVAFTGRDEGKVREAEANYRNAFPDGEVYGFAVGSLLDDRTVDTEGAEELFRKLDEMDLAPDCLVCNAADQGLGMKVFENPITDFQKVLNTNVVWDYCLSELAADRMRKKEPSAGGERGSIVFVNSNTAYRAIPDRIAYEASKGGQLGMMRGLALDLGKYGIRVNAVLPGMIRTQRWVTNPDFYKTVPSRYTPLGDVADGSDIADAVYYFAAHARNTTGAELTVDGGNTIQLYPIVPKDI